MVAAERYFRSVKLNFLGSESALLENIEGGFERAAQFQGAEKGGRYPGTALSAADFVATRFWNADLFR